MRLTAREWFFLRIRSTERSQMDPIYDVVRSFHSAAVPADTTATIAAWLDSAWLAVVFSRCLRSVLGPVVWESLPQALIYFITLSHGAHFGCAVLDTTICLVCHPSRWRILVPWFSTFDLIMNLYFGPSYSDSCLLTYTSEVGILLHLTYAAIGDKAWETKEAPPNSSINDEGRGLGFRAREIGGLKNLDKEPRITLSTLLA